ncbi:MAG: OmpA family protein [Bacteroidota bacterium]
MKNFTKLFALLVLLCLGKVANAQHAKELDPGYYVVVGAYAPTRENVAQNYAEVLTRRGLKADYGFNSSRNYFFVYLNYFTDLKSSLRDMHKTRKQNEFSGAWVRVVAGDVASSKLIKALKPTEIVQTKTETQKPVETKVEEKPVDTKSTTTASTGETQLVPSEIVVTDNPDIKQYNPITLGNTEVFLSMFNATNNRIVDGNVKVIDTERAKLLKEVNGNEYLILPDPKSKSGQLTLICEAFGYRKVQQEINYPLPLADTVKENIDLMGTTFVINFDLIRYHSGDIATLYHVYFYNDAALMLPESKYELNSLLQMMQENVKYRIRLHGHTNGNYHGRIITQGDEKVFFTLEGSKSGVGTAKDLSLARAQIIKNYLVANGIDPARIEVKAWGGKRPIFDKHSVNAKKNVRVEVEILSE